MVGLQEQRSSLEVEVVEDHLDAAVGDPVVGLQDQRLSLEVEVAEDHLDAAVVVPAVGLQEGRSSLEVEVVGDHLDAAVEDPQAMAWEEDTAAAVGDQARRSLLAQVVEEVAHLDAAVGVPAVGLQEGRSSLEVGVVEDPLDAAVEDPVVAVAVPRAMQSSSALEGAAEDPTSLHSRNAPLSFPTSSLIRPSRPATGPPATRSNSHSRRLFSLRTALPLSSKLACFLPACLLPFSSLDAASLC